VVFWPAVAGDEKTHDRCQPWVFVEIICSPSTSPGRAACYDDDQPINL
jgi:hypothetical protein